MPPPFWRACFDCATREKRLTHIPGNGRQLVEDMKRSNGALPGMLGWVTGRQNCATGFCIAFRWRTFSRIPVKGLWLKPGPTC